MYRVRTRGGRAKYTCYGTNSISRAGSRSGNYTTRCYTEISNRDCRYHGLMASDPSKQKSATGTFVNARHSIHASVGNSLRLDRCFSHTPEGRAMGFTPLCLCPGGHFNPDLHPSAEQRRASHAIIHTPYSRGRTQTRRPTLSTLRQQIRSMPSVSLVTASETLCRLTLAATCVRPTSCLHSSHPDALRTTHDLCASKRQADARARTRTSPLSP